MRRSPVRIDRMLDAIRKLWYTYPDLRLGQLIGNVIPVGIDPYFIEDDKLLEAIEEYYLEHARK